jgi:group I intron endonuclease
MKDLATIQKIIDIKPIEGADAVEMGFIYKITNIVNNKVYIGKSTYKNIDEVKKRYKKEVLYGVNRYIIKAIKKYGIDFFVFKIVENNIKSTELNNKEIFYINYFNSYNKGYNLTIGGEGNKGYKWSIESKNKLSEKFIGKRKNTENPFYGKKHSLNTIDKIIKSNKRRAGNKYGPMSQDRKEKISKALIGKTPWNKGKTYDAVKGIKNPNYKEVDMEKLKKLLDAGKDYKFICNALNISSSLFYKRKKLLI